MTVSPHLCWESQEEVFWKSLVKGLILHFASPETQFCPPVQATQILRDFMLTDF